MDIQYFKLSCISIIAVQNKKHKQLYIKFICFTHFTSLGFYSQCAYICKVLIEI